MNLFRGVLLLTIGISVGAKAEVAANGSSSVFVHANAFLAATPAEQKAYIKSIRNLVMNFEKHQTLLYGDSQLSSSERYALLSLLFEIANADGSQKSPRGAVRDSSSGISVGDSCYFAGNESQVVSFNGGLLCSATKLRSGLYESNLRKLGFSEAGLSTRLSCGRGKMACNPIWFGYEDNGNPICVPYVGATNKCKDRADKLDPKLDKAVKIWQQLAKKDPAKFNKLAAQFADVNKSCAGIKITQSDCVTAHNRAKAIYARYQNTIGKIAANSIQSVSKKHVCDLDVGGKSKKVLASYTKGKADSTGYLVANLGTVEIENSDPGLQITVEDTSDPNTKKYSATYQGEKHEGEITFRIDSKADFSCVAKETSHKKLDSDKTNVKAASLAPVNPPPPSTPATNPCDKQTPGWDQLCVVKDNLVNCKKTVSKYVVSPLKGNKFEISKKLTEDEGGSKIADVEIKKENQIEIRSTTPDAPEAKTFQEMMRAMFVDRTDKPQKRYTTEIANISHAIAAVATKDFNTTQTVEKLFNKAQEKCKQKSGKQLLKVTDDTQKFTLFACGHLDDKGKGQKFYGEFLNIYKEGAETRIAAGGLSDENQRKNAKGEDVLDPGMNGLFYPLTSQIYRVGDAKPYLDLSIETNAKRTNVYNVILDTCPNKAVEDGDDFTGKEPDYNVLFKRDLGSGNFEIVGCESRNPSGPWESFMKIPNGTFKNDFHFGQVVLVDKNGIKRQVTTDPGTYSIGIRKMGDKNVCLVSDGSNQTFDVAPFNFGWPSSGTTSNFGDH